MGDLEKLVSAGISHIRIPYGYWLVDVAADEPFPAPPESDSQGQRFYLKRMLGWAESVGLKVLLDLHAAPGSQNGFDNSGQRGEIHWHEENRPERTVTILGKVARLVRRWIDDGDIKAETIVGIELLNEPAGFHDYIWDICRNSFYFDGYAEIRSVFPDQVSLNQSMIVSIQQAFKDYSVFDDFMQPHVSI